MNASKGLLTMSAIFTSDSTIDFVKRFTASDQFEKVFKEGMGLVEETANYLDGPGRQDARQLDRHATESMRLTTRLMQLASWLLLQRAIGAGEMSQDEARKEKHRISLSDIGRGNPLTGEEQLPAALKEIVERSLRLHQRILNLDAMLNAPQQPEVPAASPVSEQLDRLATALKVARG
jgi:regulator of CtrA degradation